MFMLDNGYPNQDAVKVGLHNTQKYVDMVNVIYK